MRTTTNELVIFRLADAGILARWPIGELAVLGDVQHEVTPPIVRKGSEARLVVDDPELSRQLAALVPQLAPLAGTRPAPATRIAALRRHLRRTGRAVLARRRLRHRICGTAACPTACRPSWARACSTS